MRANRLGPTRCLQRRPAAPRALEERQQTRQQSREQTPFVPAGSTRSGEGGGLCALVGVEARKTTAAILVLWLVWLVGGVGIETLIRNLTPPQ